MSHYITESNDRLGRLICVLFTIYVTYTILSGLYY